MARCIMVQGTCSNAGKSLLCAALCRIFRQDGYRVAPFKSQNMALNSFITAGGKEMGRAQVVQAEAAGIPPDVRMNPILLKPTSDTGSQVVVMGEACGNRTAREYWGGKKALLPIVRDAYDSLAAEYDIIVIEGAGSPAEINLKQDDIVNMGLAKLVDAPVLLVGDIDRGGVFASLYGTVALLEAEEQARVRGLIVNKFRGDVELLRPGLTQLERLTGKPVVGVVPYGRFDIDDEDSLSARLDACGAPALVDIAVVRLPRLSNFTDFSPLERIEGVGVRYAGAPEQLEGADLILLPGTKSTLADLKWLRESGMEAQLLKWHAAGVPVFGVCGGYQMMGRAVSDPENTEGGGVMRGLGLLPVETVFRPVKTTAQASGAFGTVGGVLRGLSGAGASGYEIHMGETARDAGALPLIRLTRADGTSFWDGCQADSAYGTYLHGLFDMPDAAQALVQALAARRGVMLADTACDTARYKERQYDLLADTDQNLLAYLSRWIGKKAVLTENALLLALLTALDGSAAPIAADGALKAIKTLVNTKLDPIFGAGASFLTNQSGFNFLDTLEDGNGRPLLQVNPADRTQYMVGGRAVHVVSDAVLPNKTAAPLYVGDFKSFGTLFRRQPMEIASTNIGGNAWATNSTEVRAITRLDAKTFDAKAVQAGKITLA